jgi:transposase
VRSHLFTFLEHPEVPPDNNGSERELRPTALVASAPAGVPICSPPFDPSSAPHHDAYQAIRAVLDGKSVIQPG